jgi:hypothetical protein
VEGSCECGNEPSVSIKRSEVLEQFAAFQEVLSSMKLVHPIYVKIFQEVSCNNFLGVYDLPMRVICSV